jgi:hypothetical protein
VTIYLAALDETQNSKGDFTLGGFIAPTVDWAKWFQPAWQERVLDGPPSIPYLHMSEAWGEDWQTKYGVSGNQVYERIEEAARVIRSMGSLYPMTSAMIVSDFEKEFAGPLKKLNSGEWEIVKDPDYLCFIAVSLLSLQYVQQTCPDATRLDLLIEESEKTSANMELFHQHLDDVVAQFPELAAIRGTLSVGQKESIPLQAADTLLWHVQRANAGRLTRPELRRFARIANRHGYVHRHMVVDLNDLREGLTEGIIARQQSVDGSAL